MVSQAMHSCGATNLDWRKRLPRSSCKRASLIVVLGGEKGPRFPDFGEEFLVQSFLQIADAFRTAGPAFAANHALDHPDVMRPPEEKVFIVLEQRFGELILFVELFRMTKNFAHRALAFSMIGAAFFLVAGRFAGRRVEPAPAQQSEERFAERRRPHARLQALAGKV